MIKVLFVCLGNICRSPMADAVFQNQVKSAGLADQIYVDSAGTSRYHIGDKAHSGTLAVLKKYDIPYDGRARQLIEADLQEYDYVLAMDSDNLYNIESMVRDGDTCKVGMFLSYAHNNNTVDRLDVPDPYYDGRFEYVYQLVTKGGQALLDHIRETHKI